MAGPDPENKRKISQAPAGGIQDTGAREGEFPTQHDLGAMDPFESSKHPPATRELDPNDVRQRPYPESSTDTYPDHPADLGFDK